jgi:hypothetical protein
MAGYLSAASMSCIASSNEHAAVKEHPTKLALRSGLDLRRLVGLLFYAAAAGLIIEVFTRLLVKLTGQGAAESLPTGTLNLQWSILLRDVMGTLGIFSILLLAGYVARRQVNRADLGESGP